MKTTSRHLSDKLTTEERDLLPSSDFGIPEAREFPMPDAAHVRAAEAYFRYASETDKPLLAYRFIFNAQDYVVEVKCATFLEWAEKYKP